MLLERVIRQPESLEQAEQVFRRWAAERGYELIGAAHTYWQPNLFTEAMDVLVEASARRANG